MLAHPKDALCRVQQRRDLRHFGADRQIDYGARSDWEARLHRQLGLEWPCPLHERFLEIYDELARSLRDFPRGHDADASLACAIWCLTCHMRPEKVIETGVARGVSTRFVLEGLARNQCGKLWSIDLPPVLAGFHDAVGAAVPDGNLRDRWMYVRGPSRRMLPRVLGAVSPIDLFIQDSVGTPPTVRFELALAWKALSPQGWLVVNGINRSGAFGDFVERHRTSCCIVGSAREKAGFLSTDHAVIGQFGMLQKPKADES